MAILSQEAVHRSFSKKQAPGDLNFVRDLSRELVVGEGGHEADHAARDLGRYRDEVRVRQGGHLPEAIESPADLIELAGIPHGVERRAAETAAQHLGHAEHAVTLAKGRAEAVLGRGRVVQETNYQYI